MGKARVLAVCGVLAGTLQLHCVSGTFECHSDDQCSGGTCSAGGWCAFGDDACASGLRYGAGAGDGLAGQCVPVGGTDGGTTGGDDLPTTTPPATTDAPPSTTANPSSSGPTTDAMTSDTGLPGVCGDEVQDAGEDCDDGNDVAGDGCDPDCTRSGEVLWLDEIDAGGNDAYRDIALSDDGVAVTGDLDGTPVWVVYGPDGDAGDPYVITEEAAGQSWGIATLEAVVVVGGATADGVGFVGMAGIGGEPWVYFETAEEVFDVAVGDAGDVTVWTCGSLDGAPIATEYDSTGVPLTTITMEGLPVGGTAWDLVLDGIDLYVVGQGGDQDDPLPWIRALLVTGESSWEVDVDEMASPGGAYGAAIADDSLAVVGSIQVGSQPQGFVALLDPATGDQAWVATLTSDRGSFANIHKAAIGPSGEIVAVGWVAVSDVDADIWIGKYDVDGDAVWEQTFAGTGDRDGNGFGVVVHDDGSITAVGASHNADYDAWIAHLEP